MDKNLGLMTLFANFIGGVYSRFDTLGLRLIRPRIFAVMPDRPLPLVKDNEVPLLSHGCCQEARNELRGISDRIVSNAALFFRDFVEPRYPDVKSLFENRPRIVNRGSHPG
jgi:hypothetical protein